MVDRPVLPRIGRLLDFESIGLGAVWSLAAAAGAELLGIWPALGVPAGIAIGAASAVAARWRHAEAPGVVAVALAWTAFSALVAFTLFTYAVFVPSPVTPLAADPGALDEACGSASGTCDFDPAIDTDA